MIKLTESQSKGSFGGHVVAEESARCARMSDEMEMESKAIGDERL
jgi:hypothetical protein